jgi:hypothetical protein
MTYKLISCEVLYRELCHEIARSPHQIDAEFLPKGLHDIGAEGMSGRLQTAIDAVDPTRYDAILLGYALCNNGIAGLRARSIPLVVPRGHDCMTLFFGSRDRYMEFFQNNPGTYFLTSGWIERGEAIGELQQLSISHQTGMDSTYAELVAKYGEDNAKYLYETLCEHTRNYRQITFIDMGIGPQDDFAARARKTADEKGWTFTRTTGTMRILTDLVMGVWKDEDVLVVPPGCRIVATFDESIIRAEPADQ